MTLHSPTSRRSRNRPLVFSTASRCTAVACLGAAAWATSLAAQTTPPPLPVVVDPDLAVRAVVGDLAQPIAIAFLRPNDFLVTEKGSGQVKRVINGAVAATVLDLPVNSASERGLLGIALHPDFRRNHWVYLYWTESSTGADSTELAEVGNPNSPYGPDTPAPLGNRIDRFVWDGRKQQLKFDRNLVRLRAYQADADQPLRGNHNGGLLAFEERDDAWKHDVHAKKPWSPHRDERAKLFVIIGDNGRRGMLQNLLHGPFGPGQPDDQFGGPEPDNAHLTGVVLRLNEDGSTPTDNPFYAFGASVGGEEGKNIQKIFAYGVRNSFGLAVDPWTGELWESENGDDSFDEINRIEPGHNGGWVQAMGPLARLTQFKAIETMPPPFFGLQQVRWSPENLADDPITARERLVDFPGSHYGEPQFSWKWATAPAAIGFMGDRSLGRRYRGDLFVGASIPVLTGGYLFRFELTPNRQRLAWSDERLADLVADNLAKHEITESESLLFGTGFGATTDIKTGPWGNLFVVSVSHGIVYEIYRTKLSDD